MKDIDDLLIARFTVGFPPDAAEVLRALAHQRRVSVSDLIRAATLRDLESLIPAPPRVVHPSDKRRIK